MPFPIFERRYSSTHNAIRALAHVLAIELRGSANEVNGEAEKPDHEKLGFKVSRVIYPEKQEAKLGWIDWAVPHGPMAQLLMADG